MILSYSTQQKEINEKLTNLQIMFWQFDSTNKEKINKDWFKDIIDPITNPTKAEKKRDSYWFG